MGSDGPATTEYRFEVQEQPNVVSAGGAEEAAEALDERLDKLGVKGGSARAEGSKLVVVELPKKQANVVSLLYTIQQPGRLELYDLQKSLIAPSIDARGFPVAAADYDKLTKGLPEDVVILRCGEGQAYCPGLQKRPTRTYYYALDGGPALTGTDFKRDGTRQEFEARTGEPVVLLEFTEKGARTFHELTRELSTRGRLAASHEGVPDELAFQQFAIVVDGALMAAPVVDFNENPDGIPAGNGAQISGLGSPQEARNLAILLSSGELPVMAAARGS